MTPIIPQEYTNSAQIIQRSYRRHKACKDLEFARCSILSIENFLQAKQVITEHTYTHLPKAVNGKTPVYILGSGNCVIKETGTFLAKKRFEAMNATRKLVMALSLDQLVIPKARVFHEFIIEERLPIQFFDLKEQMAHYSEHLDIYTAAIEQLSRLLCYVRLDDITGNTTHRYTSVSDTPLGRFDNVPLFLNKETGKIGLVDLEKSQFDRSAICPFTAAKQLIHLFPVHADTICQEISNHFPELKLYEAALEKETADSLKRLKTIYLDHAEFLKRHELKKLNDFLFDRLNLKDKEAFSDELFDAIYAKHLNCHLMKGFLGPQPKELLKDFIENRLGFFMEALKKLILDLIDYNISKLQTPPERLCFETLVALRSISIPYGFESKELSEFKSSVLPLIHDFALSTFHAGIFLTFLLDTTLSSFHKSGFVAYYNPAYASGTLLARLVFV